MARSLFVDVLIGAAAGAAATWLMDQATTLLQERQPEDVTKREKAASNPSSPAKRPAVHWTLGIATGALYGALRNRARGMRAESGLAYGTAVFLLVDEAAQTALGFSPPPQAFPWQTHARGLAGHLVMGAVLEAPFDVLDLAA